MQGNGASTLAVILGAAAFPRYPGLTGGAAFASSARAVEDGLATQFGADWKQGHLLNLFDSDDVPRMQLRQLRDFCAANRESRKLVVYYVGHGGFFGGQNYYLALRATEKGDEPYTGLEIRNLALLLDQCFPGRRIILILDCCFAAEAMAQFQDAGAVSRAVEAETFNAFPAAGTSLLCASSRDDMALWQGSGSQTMFSECLTEVLASGMPGKAEWLNLHDVGEAVATLVRSRFGHRSVRPEVHSPRQRGTDVATEPLFRNVAYRPPQPKRLPAEIAVALINPVPQVRIGGVTALLHLAEAGDHGVLALVQRHLGDLANNDDSLSVRAAARKALEQLAPTVSHEERVPPRGEPAAQRAGRRSGHDEPATDFAAPPPAQARRAAEGRRMADGGQEGRGVGAGRPATSGEHASGGWGPFAVDRRGVLLMGLVVPLVYALGPTPLSFLAGWPFNTIVVSLVCGCILGWAFREAMGEEGWRAPLILGGAWAAGAFLNFVFVNSGFIESRQMYLLFGQVDRIAAGLALGLAFLPRADKRGTHIALIVAAWAGLGAVSGLLLVLLDDVRLTLFDWGPLLHVELTSLAIHILALGTSALATHYFLKRATAGLSRRPA